mmetsp:Transcript_75922/g.246374  ORF Transcript_75922/g.246374 Transcript_75922/m.246374 type:complete len:305 (+) Transcript_75922:196-1110(+)
MFAQAQDADTHHGCQFPGALYTMSQQPCATQSSLSALMEVLDIKWAATQDRVQRTTTTDLQGCSKPVDGHNVRHRPSPGIVDQWRLNDEPLDFPYELPVREARQRCAAAGATQRLRKLADFKFRELALVDSIQHLAECACFTNAVQRRRVREPIVAVAGDLLGLAHYVVKDVKRQLQLLVNIVVEFHRRLIVRAETDDELQWKVRTEVAQRGDEALFVCIRRGARIRRGWQAIGDNCEKDQLPPLCQPRGLRIDALVDLIEPGHQRRHSPRAIVPQEGAQLLQLRSHVAQGSVDVETVTTLLHA